MEERWIVVSKMDDGVHWEKVAGPFPSSRQATGAKRDMIADGFDGTLMVTAE